jgi:hypothetical protein
MKENLAFEKLVDEWVSARLQATMDWDELLYSLPGVYPATVWESVRRLSIDDRISFRRESAGGTRGSFASRLWDQGKLLTPHPQDSLWWFGDVALERLLGELTKSAGDSGGVLLLGTPTLFHYVKVHSLKSQVLLLDLESPTLCKGQYRALSCDLFADIGGGEKFDFVVADPPWYPLETRAFLLAGLRRSHQSTKVLLSVPGTGTRPGIRREWEELLRWAETNGLRLLDYQARALPYISPLFERNALRSVGIENYPTDWRQGDLAIFEVNRLVDAPTLGGRFERRWREVRFGRVRLRVREDAFGRWRSPELRSVALGGILPSVSRRDPRLKSIAVWTSGNRAFGCDDSSAFWKIAEAVSLGRCPRSGLSTKTGAALNESERKEVNSAVSQLVELIAVEEQEIQDWRTERNEDVVELPARQS